MIPVPISEVAIPTDFTLHSYGTGEKMPIRMPVFQAQGNPTEGYRIALGFYATGDSTAWTLSYEQFQEFLRIQALSQLSASLLQLLIPQGTIGGEREPSPKERLLRRILALRDAIEAERGILSESYSLIREDRER
jgi:hypothetical protein